MRLRMEQPGSFDIHKYHVCFQCQNCGKETRLAFTKESEVGYANEKCLWRSIEPSIAAVLSKLQERVLVF